MSIATGLNRVLSGCFLYEATLLGVVCDLYSCSLSCEKLALLYTKKINKENSDGEAKLEGA